MGESILDIRDLCSTNTGSVRLKEINLEVFPAETHALVGERGAGKELLVNILAGLEKRISGRIFFDEVDVTGSLKIGSSTSMMFLLEEPMLAEGLTVAENIYIMREPRNILRFISYSKINRHVKDLLTGFSLDIQERSSVFKLSVEDRKIVELVRLFFYEPKMIVMYEPTANLSSKSQELFFRILSELKRKNTGILYVTNKWDDALKFADRISVLYEGSLAGTLSSSEAKKKPEKLLKLLSGWDRKGHGIEGSDNFENEDVVEAVLKAAEYLTSNYEINDVLKMLESYACKIMESDACYVYLVDEKTRTIMDTVKFKENETIEAILKDEVVMKIMEDKKLFRACSEEEGFTDLFKITRNVEMAIFDPVLIRSHYTALIQVSYCKRYEPTEKQTRFLYTLSRQAALAIDNTRLMGSSILLQESHHRIKNNLQTIVSLINMQKRSFHRNTAKEVNDLLENIVSRVKSIAAVHDLLSRDELGRSIINLKNLVDAILQFNVVDGKPKIDKDLDDIFIPYDKATSISLTINELMNNCIKHAFKNTDNAAIIISCKNLDDKIRIVVEDNGIGFPNRAFDTNNERLGLSLVRSVVENQFGGVLNVFTDNGTRVEILIPNEGLLLTRHR